MDQHTASVSQCEFGGLNQGDQHTASVKLWEGESGTVDQHTASVSPV